MNYRKEIVSLMINNIESGVDFKAKDIDLLVAMRLIINSLKNISNSVIINCFRV